MKTDKKQKSKSAEEVISAYVQEPPIKMIAVEKGTKKGYRCTLKDNVVLFSDFDKEEEITDWLMNEFGKDETVHGKTAKNIPFSFGFSKFALTE